MIWATRGYCSVIDEVLGVNEFVPKDNSRKTIIHLFVSLFFQNETIVITIRTWRDIGRVRVYLEGVDKRSDKHSKDQEEAKISHNACFHSYRGEKKSIKLQESTSKLFLPC